MSAAPLTQMLQNAFEEWLSTDANRLQRLISREVQNLFRGGQKDLAGTPINGLTDPMSLTSVAATFGMTLEGAGGFLNITSGIGTDDSPYAVLRWADQVVTFGIPDGVDPRIDVVVATAGTLDSDSESRNILTDPANHTFAAANVNKTRSPYSTISVVPGTPDPNPVPTAIADPNSTVLYEVRVPAAAPDSSTFLVTQRLFRLAPWPWAGMNAVLSGVGLRWLEPSVLPSVAETAPGQYNVVIIDGEIIPFKSGTAIGPAGHRDSGADPFSVGNAAPAGNDQPYYVYLVGGRWSPQASAVASDCPVGMVYSLTPPDRVTGQPSVGIETVRGDVIQVGAVYIGMGYTEAGTSTSKLCIVDGDWIYPMAPSPTGGGFEFQAVSLVGATTDVTLGSAPPFAQCVKVGIFTQPDTGTISDGFISVEPNPGPTGAGFVVAPMTVIAGPIALVAGGQGDVAIRTGTPQLLIRNTARVGAGATDSVDLVALGYRHHAPRLDGGAGLGG